MKHKPATRRAFVALAPATLLLAVPGYAQEIQPPAAATPPAQQTVTPPPVVPTIAPQVSTTPPADTTVAPPVVTQTVPGAPETAATSETTRTRTTRTETRSTRVVRSAAPVRQNRASAPVAAAPVAAPAAVTLPTTTTAPAEATTPSPAPIADEAASQSAVTQQSAPIWPWLVAGLVVLGGVIAFLMMRRRRADEEEDVYYEDAYVDAAPVDVAPIREPAPIVPAPEAQFLHTTPVAETLRQEPIAVAAEEVELAEPEAEEVAALIEAKAPVSDRPWLEMALRPVRAGTNVDEALVEIELTVGNAGSVAAQDVRISTFMFASEPAAGTEMEQMLIERGDEGVPPVSIEPGEGTRIDATLALPKAELIESTNGSILPIVVAEARYTLPDGSEGRTSASFTIGVSGDGGPAMSPIHLDERAMHEDVEARLHGVPEHA